MGGYSFYFEVWLSEFDVFLIYVFDLVENFDVMILRYLLILIFLIDSNLWLEYWRIGWKLLFFVNILFVEFVVSSDGVVYFYLVKMNGI